MPQINQLALVAYSQWFWLLVTLGLIYFGIGRAMLPKIQSTVEARETRVAEDLAAADAARNEADDIEEAYRQRMDHSRGEAIKLTAVAKQKGAAETERRAAEADAAILAQLSDAAGRIAAASKAARDGIESAAAEMTQEIVAKVAGLAIPADDAAQAVKAVANG